MQGYYSYYQVMVNDSRTAQNHKGVNMGAINGNIMKKLKNLSNIAETEYPFITLYMDINAQELFEQNRKNRIFLKNSINKTEYKFMEMKDKRKLESFRNDAGKIQDYFEKNVEAKAHGRKPESDENKRAHGIAIFACHELGIFEVFYSIIPFENEFVINSIPHLKQLAYHAEECENALVIMSDAKYASIFAVKLGGFIIDEQTFEHTVHRFHKQGGWAQMRYQRHIENQVHKHYSDVAKVATQLIDENNFDNVILIGQHHEIKNFEEWLPKRIKKEVICLDAVYKRENINTILETIMENLRNSEDEKELNYVEEIIEKAPRNSVTGMQDTMKLVQEGRSEILVLPNYKTYEGWKCDGCLYVSRDQHQPGCAVCNGNAKQTDLIEELVLLNLRNNGKVEIVKNHAARELEKYEGIGALIRY